MKFALVSFVLFSVALAVPSSQHIARDPQRQPARPPGNSCSAADRVTVSFQLIILHLRLLTHSGFRVPFVPWVVTVQALNFSMRWKFF
jgi:hypothetical protein